MFRGLMYYWVVSFGVLLCFTGVGIVFGVPLILVAEQVRKEFSR